MMENNYNSRRSIRTLGNGYVPMKFNVLFKKQTPILNKNPLFSLWQELLQSKIIIKQHMSDNCNSFLEQEQLGNYHNMQFWQKLYVTCPLEAAECLSGPEVQFISAKVSKSQSNTYFQSVLQGCARKGNVHQPVVGEVFEQQEQFTVVLCLKMQMLWKFFLALLLEIMAQRAGLLQAQTRIFQ